MRIFTALPLFLFACAPAEDAPTATEAALATGPTVHFEYSVEAADITLFPVRFDTEGQVSWMGSALATGKVEDGIASVTLPLRAAARDKDSAAPNAPVTYWVFASKYDSEGEITYQGIGSDRIMYFNGKDRKKSGWYVATPGQTRTTYSSTDRIVQIDTTIRPQEAVALVGHTGEVPDVPLGFGFEYGENVLDKEGWSAAMTDAPSFDFVVSGASPIFEETDDGAYAGQFTPRGFDDENGNGVWDIEENEKAVGQVCFGGRSVSIEWHSGAATPEVALQYHLSQTVTGWHAYATSEEGRERLNSPPQFVMHGDCAEALANATEPQDQGDQPG